MYCMVNSSFSPLRGSLFFMLDRGVMAEMNDDEQMLSLCLNGKCNGYIGDTPENTI